MLIKNTFIKIIQKKLNSRNINNSKNVKGCTKYVLTIYKPLKQKKIVIY